MKKTYHDGAREERSAWMQKLRNTTQEPVIAKLIAWGKARPSRYKKRVGGL